LTTAGSEGSRGLLAGFWIVTALFCREMSFTGYYQLVRLPEAAHALSRRRFPADSFRVELSWTKVAGINALLLPVARARRFVYVVKDGRTPGSRST
jgi:hypothetical protein